MHKHRRYTASSTSYLYSETGETSLTGGKRVGVTPEKRIPKKKKNIKSNALSPFLPRNKRLLNEESDNNPTLQILQYMKNMICHILVQMILLKNKGKIKYK